VANKRNKQTDRQIDGQTDRETNNAIEMQLARRHRYICIYASTCESTLNCIVEISEANTHIPHRQNKTTNKTANGKLAKLSKTF